MAIRNIVEKGDPILARKSRNVEEITPRIKQLIEDMIETMNEAQGVGIAAPQVGIGRRLCIIAPEEGDVRVLINPEILESRGQVESIEGCLSVPGATGIVDRPEYIKIKYIDEDGKEKIEELEGFPAIVACHEIDHLEGVLYVDKARNVRYVEDEEK